MGMKGLLEKQLAQGGESSTGRQLPAESLLLPGFSPEINPRNTSGHLQSVLSAVQVDMPWLWLGLPASPRDSISAPRAGIPQHWCQAKQ